MGQAELHVQGLQELIERLRQLPTGALAMAKRIFWRRLPEAATFMRARYLTGGTTVDRLAVRSGRLRDSVLAKVVDGASGEVIGHIGYLYNPPMYARVHEGWPDRRQSTTIRAKRGPYLIIPLVIDGALTFRKKREVVIPARPALYPTMDRFVPIMREDLRKGMLELVKSGVKVTG